MNYSRTVSGLQSGNNLSHHVESSSQRKRRTIIQSRAFDVFSGNEVNTEVTCFTNFIDGDDVGMIEC